MTFLFILGFLMLCAAGGFTARMDGGGEPKTPEIVERLLCMSFFVIGLIPSSGWWSILAIAGMFGLATGHGQYFLSLLIRAVDGERLDFFVRLFFGRDPRTDTEFLHLRGKWEQATEYDRMRLQKLVIQYGERKLFWRNVFGMFVTGTFVGLPGAIVALCNGAYLTAGLMACTGLAKAAAYYFNRPFTVPAEWTNGILRTALALFGGLLLVL